MQKILTPDFFNQPTIFVAQELLGKYLVRKINNQIISLKINEVEAYDGPNDLACHASKGKTERTKIMFGPPGYFYVYMIYGMYWMLNIVTGPKDYPCAILIRGAGKFNGPGKLTKNLLIDKTFNSKLASIDTELWFEDSNEKIFKKNIIKTPRIGVNYAGPIWSKKLYRFVLKED
ncbi:MAG: DNA-3-methyladenine glycosylase [bacterium]